MGLWARAAIPPGCRGVVWVLSSGDRVPVRRVGQRDRERRGLVCPRPVKAKDVGTVHQYSWRELREAIEDLRLSRQWG
jgi:hypothetical protein